MPRSLPPPQNWMLIITLNLKWISSNRTLLIFMNFETKWRYQGRSFVISGGGARDTKNEVKKYWPFARPIGTVAPLEPTHPPPGGWGSPTLKRSLIERGQGGHDTTDAATSIPEERPGEHYRGEVSGRRAEALQCRSSEMECPQRECAGTGGAEGGAGCLRTTTCRDRCDRR